MEDHLPERTRSNLEAVAGATAVIEVIPDTPAEARVYAAAVARYRTARRAAPAPTVKPTSQPRARERRDGSARRRTSSSSSGDAGDSDPPPPLARTTARHRAVETGPARKAHAALDRAFEDALADDDDPPDPRGTLPLFMGWR